MSKHIILAQSRAAASALECVLELVTPKWQGEPRRPKSIIWLDEQVDLVAFRYLAEAMEKVAAEQDGNIPLGEVVVLVDTINLTQLDPTESGGWDNVIAMLILAFPEFRWIFGVTREAGPKTDHLEHAHGLAALLRPCGDSLFDASGLRNWVRCLAAKNVRQAAYLPLRQQLAVAIDDEESYVYFNAFVAYRFGFRTDVITSFELMAELYGPNQERTDHLCQVSFEDLFLNFPGRTRSAVTSPVTMKEVHLSCLRARDEVYPGLKLIPCRIFVSTGQNQTDRDGLWHDNDAYLEDWQSQGDGLEYKSLWKPLAGMFNLWKDSGLLSRMKRLNRDTEEEIERDHLALAPGFRWPPTKELDCDSELGHSAPDKLLEIGNKLLNRAERFLEKTRTVTDAVHGAVLATDAQEILGNRVPTTSLHALALKHQFESIAECRFYGVDFNVDVETRFDEIRRDVGAIGRWFHAKRRKYLRLNSELALVRELTLVFRDHNQFDEERECIAHSRSLFRDLWFSEHPFAIPFRPIAWYISFLLVSIPRFVGCLAAWVVIIAVAFQLSASIPGGADASASAPMSFWVCLQKSFETCFSVQAVNPPFSVLNEFAILLAFVHLGVFISHLYAVVSRR